MFRLLKPVPGNETDARVLPEFTSVECQLEGTKLKRFGIRLDTIG
jgi:hypothetical protein